MLPVGKCTDLVGVGDPRLEAIEDRRAEIMHGDHQRRMDRRDHLHHVGLAQGEGAVDRRQQHVDLAERRQMLRRQRVMEMAEMGDAEIAGGEDEDRVAAVLGAAAAVADVGGHVADPHVAELHVVVRRSLAGVPAAQHQLDAGVDVVGVVAGVRVVHRHHVGRVLRPEVAVVVRDDGDAARALDEEAGMAEEGKADLRFFGGKARAEGGGNQERLCPGHHVGAGAIGIGRCQRQQRQQRQAARSRRPKRARAEARPMASLICCSAINEVCTAPRAGESGWRVRCRRRRRRGSPAVLPGGRSRDRGCRGRSPPPRRCPAAPPASAPRPT